MYNVELEKLINKKLNSESIKDHTPNGLQVEGRAIVKNIITGVTASQLLLDIAVEHQADAIIVHHGYFWKNESLIINNMKRKRLKTILMHDINLYSWHLPLDIHSELGNNIQLANILNIEVIGSLNSIVLYGKFNCSEINSKILRQQLEIKLKRPVLHYKENAPTKIKNVAWCTGSGQNFIELAANAKMDAFITGEVSEQTIHVAREMGLHFYAAGHHATERGGIYALGNWLEQYDLNVNFIDIDNPA